jgi:hypothetical protein
MLTSFLIHEIIPTMDCFEVEKIFDSIFECILESQSFVQEEISIVKTTHFLRWFHNTTVDDLIELLVESSNGHFIGYLFHRLLVNSINISEGILDSKLINTIRCMRVEVHS